MLIYQVSAHLDFSWLKKNSSPNVLIYLPNQQIYLHRSDVYLSQSRLQDNLQYIYKNNSLLCAGHAVSIAAVT